MKKNYKNNIIKTTKNFLCLLVLFLLLPTSYFLAPSAAYAQQSVYVDASTLLSKVALLLSPHSASVLKGGTIKVSIFLNTKNSSINTIDLAVHFDPTKMIIINPTGDNSIIGIWVQPPTYSNTDGILKLTGIIPSGITTENGLITTITFRAIATGKTLVAISDASRVFANDGQGTEVDIQVDSGVYTITSEPIVEEVSVFSGTHPLEDFWYKNKNPMILWDKPEGITGFSFTLDGEATTIPDNNIDTQNSFTSYSNIDNGIWYFHIKAQKDGVWGPITHFMMHIDSTPPLTFTPKIETKTINGQKKNYITFSSKDTLSEIDYYEIRAIPSDASSSSPSLFVRTNSPYEIPASVFRDTRFLIRAYDKAGNRADASITISSDAAGNITAQSAQISLPLRALGFIQRNFLLLSLLLLYLGYYFYLHRFVPRIKP